MITPRAWPPQLERAGLSRSLGPSEAESALQALEQEAAAAEGRAESLVHTRDTLARRQEELGSALGHAKAQAEAAEAEAAKWQQEAEMATREEEQRVAAAEEKLAAVRGQQARCVPARDTSRGGRGVRAHPLPLRAFPAGRPPFPPSSARSQAVPWSLSRSTSLCSPCAPTSAAWKRKRQCRPRPSPCAWSCCLGPAPTPGGGV